MLSRTGPQSRAGAFLPVWAVFPWSHQSSQRLQAGQTQARDVYYIQVSISVQFIFHQIFIWIFSCSILTRCRPCSGKSDYVEPAKRAHIMAAPRGRGGRGGFGQNLSRPHDIFRQRKQNTSRPPSMHVDDFVAAEFKDITTPLGLLPPKRLPKSSPKPPTRGLFTGNRGRATFHNQTRFFTPPQPKSVLLSGRYSQQRSS